MSTHLISHVIVGNRTIGYNPLDKTDHDGMRVIAILRRGQTVCIVLRPIVNFNHDQGLPKDSDKTISEYVAQAKEIGIDLGYMLEFIVEKDIAKANEKRDFDKVSWMLSSTKPEFGCECNGVLA